ncbi:pleckstrin homology domain-containing family H member 3 isoform X1 [Stegostoma tigrinum]|uniref:pleckstrin homology domain-containing family H member 3 isoform X1 n=1 Tax=Stegostoma tigrinum TaxID=3053191 RepID=UPI00202B0E1D|nr:pleckstrin homology domain-containing family H member 3 isoform X1 [Stegostoma tigrinum]
MPLRALCLWPCCRRGFTLLSRREYGETEKAEELQELQKERASSDLNLTESLAVDTADRCCFRPEEILGERRSLTKEKMKREMVTGIDQGIIMQGWLFKEVQHNVKTPWLRIRKHWFVLTQDSLDYYTNHELNSKRLGTLVLTSLCSVLWPEKGTYKGTGYWNITVYGRKHHYQLYTKHLNQCVQWACAIQNVINCKAPVETPTLLLIQDIEENCTNSEVLENIYKWNPILQHTQNPLYSPLLPFPYGIGAHHLKNTKGYTTLHDEAVKVFNSLQHLETEQDPIPLIQGILQTCLDLEPLRDEIYCQLIKQTSNPPHVGSISDLRNWQLLTCMSVTFLPSTTVLKYLRFHIKRSQDQFPKTEVYKYAEFIANSLVRTKCRKCVPSCEEILVLMQREEMSCIIHYAGSKFCKVTINSHSTAGEVVNSLLMTLGLGHSQNRFALFEQNLTDRWLVADDTVVADIITRFENLAISMEQPENQWKLYFKLYCFLDSSNIPKNNLEFTLLFEQAHEMVTKSYFPASEETLLALAALRLQFTVRDFTTHVPLPKLQELFPVHVLKARVQQSVKALLSTNNKGLSHLLPGTLASSLWGSTTQKQKLEEEQLLKVRMKEEAAALMATIVEQWKQLPGMTQLEAMTAYLSIVREWSGYGATLFEVGAFMNSAVSVAQTLWLAVGAKGLALYKQGDVESMDSFDYQQISSFEVTDRNTFKISLRRKDLLFESCKVQEIVQLIKIYSANHFKTQARSDHRSRAIITGSLTNSHHCNLYSDSSTEET